MHWYFPILIVPYLAILLILYRHLLRLKVHHPEKKTSTFVSVIIACKNEQYNIPDLLRSLQEQNYDHDLYEVIIVDDNSTDSTVEVIEACLFSLNIEITRNEETGKKHALRTGIGIARGNFIVTTDADCRPSPGWLSSITSFYEAEKADLVICPVRLSRFKGFFGKFQELEFLSLQGITAGAAIMGDPVMCNGANLAFTREAYLDNAANLRFDIPTGDDVFLLHSMKKQKRRIMWLESGESIIETAASPDILSFLRQRKRWASKSTSYRDQFSIILGIVTLITNLVLAGALVASLADPEYFYVFIIMFFLKSVPDYLVLQNTTKRYGRKNLMRWFLPCQLLYPFYVIIVAAFALLC
jgi:cellulose synthase/poly-beta-1,6-N-acetylglucosamine synthase-like glycosyltransferase